MVNLRAFLAVLALVALPAFGHAAPVTVFAPSHASISAAPPKAQRTKPAPKVQDEVDLLIALLDPMTLKCEDYGRPQFLGALYYKPDFDAAKDKPELRNLLGDAEEIRYDGKMAWGANISVAEPGLYQFLTEAKPWWDEASGSFLHEQAKVILPVHGGASGWQNSFGQSLEILPLSRPYGNVAPVSFSGRLLLDGKPLEKVLVRMGCISSQREASPPLEAYTGAAGEFSFLLNSPGWWYCQAQIPGDPLKGPDGTMKPTARSTVFWQYVGELRRK